MVSEIKQITNWAPLPGDLVQAQHRYAYRPEGVEEARVLRIFWEPKLDRMLVELQYKVHNTYQIDTCPLDKFHPNANDGEPMYQIYRLRHHFYDAQGNCRYCATHRDSGESGLLEEGPRRKLFSLGDEIERDDEFMKCKRFRTFD